MKFRGKEFSPRGSNKKHTQLNDLDMVFGLLKLECPAHVAKTLGVPPTSLLYLIDKYFNEEEKSQICWARVRHRNYGRKKK